MFKTKFFEFLKNNLIFSRIIELIVVKYFELIIFILNNYYFFNFLTLFFLTNLFINFDFFLQKFEFFFQKLDFILKKFEILSLNCHRL